MLNEMLRTAGEDAIALATSNETSPASLLSTTARVDCRRVYWASHDPKEQ